MIKKGILLVTSNDLDNIKIDKKIIFNNKIKLLIKLFLTVLILYFVSNEIYRNWREITSFQWSINIGFLLLSIFFHILTFALFSKVWCYIISGFGHDIALKYGFKLAYISNLGRYIPGKFWTIFGMAYLAKKLNIKEQESVTSWVIAIIFSLPTAFLISFLSVILYPELVSDSLKAFIGNSIYYLFIITLISSIFLIFIPNKVISILNKLLKLINRPIINFELSIFTALKIYSGYFLSWISFGISFYFLLISIIPIVDIPILTCIGAYIFSYQIGFVAIFSPGGVGVREFALWSMLEPFFGSAAIGIAIIARLWNIIVEIIAAIISLLIKLPKKQREFI